MFASISWREASVDCASKGTLASGIGVGAGVGFAGGAEACWLSAVPALQTNVRIITKMIRITGCIKIIKEGQRAPHLLRGFITIADGLNGSVLRPKNPDFATSLDGRENKWY